MHWWVDAWSPSDPDPSPVASPAGSCHTWVITVSQEPLHCLTPQKTLFPSSGNWSLGPFRIPDPKSPTERSSSTPNPKPSGRGSWFCSLVFCSRLEAGPLFAASPSTETMRPRAGGPHRPRGHRLDPAARWAAPDRRPLAPRRALSHCSPHSPAPRGPAPPLCSLWQECPPFSHPPRGREGTSAGRELLLAGTSNNQVETPRALGLPQRPGP